MARSSRKRNKKKKKKKKRGQGIKFSLCGRDFAGRGKFVKKQANHFSYSGYIYFAPDFCYNKVHDMDNNLVSPVAAEPRLIKKKKKKHKGKKEVAWMYSNLDHCPDVQLLLEALR